VGETPAATGMSKLVGLSSSLAFQPFWWYVSANVLYTPDERTNYHRQYGKAFELGVVAHSRKQESESWMFKATMMMKTRTRLQVANDPLLRFRTFAIMTESVFSFQHPSEIFLTFFPVICPTVFAQIVARPLPCSFAFKVLIEPSTNLASGLMIITLLPFRNTLAQL
jgi:hypothetical protein